MAKKSTANTLASPESLPKEKPTIRLDETDFENIKNLKVDDVVTLTVKAKLSEVGRERWSNDKRIWGTFEIQSVKSDDGDPGLKGFNSVKIDKRTKGS